MEQLVATETVRWIATICGIVAAITVSLRLKPHVTGWGFVIFTGSSVAWVIAGYADDTPSLMVQNVVLTAINLIGVYRWLIVK